MLDDYGLPKMVFSVTLDNASTNVSAMQKLRPLLSKYLGIEVLEDDPARPNDQLDNPVNSMFLHQRCACRIINTIVKEALTTLKPLIETFRTAICFMNSSNQRIAAYSSYCIASNVRH